MLEPGQIFASRYRVRRCIAEGGMGAIFEAEHTATERRVALKLLFPHIMSVGNALEKFELEAKISARVNSPYIVEVLDAGFDEASKSPFLVMELLDGQTLARRIAEQGPLETEPALRLLEQVAAGLDAAHGYREPSGVPKPIVHRDLKPENLFLARQHDGTIVAKILDYGIAKVLGDTSHVSQEVRGTPLFMAFEQITAGTLSPQTDIWAYGLIAFHMLTGARYWRATERQANVQALFAEILSLPLEAPSVRLREQDVGIELPAGFDAWLLRCIDRNPSQRFASAGAASEALARVFERTSGASSKPLPERVPVSDKSQRTQTFIGAEAPAVLAAEAPVRSSGGGSVPAMATTKHRRSFPAAAVLSKSLYWLGAGAAGGAVVLGTIVWLAVREETPAPARAASASPAAQSSPAADSSERRPTASSAATSSPAAWNPTASDPAASTSATAVESPSPAIAPALPSEPATPATADVGSSRPLPLSLIETPPPRIRIAPLEQTVTAHAERGPGHPLEPALTLAENANAVSPPATRDGAPGDPAANDPESRRPKPKASRKKRPGSSEAYRIR